MFNRKRGLRRVAAIVSISSLVTGCGILSSDGPQDEGPIVVGRPAPPARSIRPRPGTAPGSCSGTSTRRCSVTPSGATAPQPDAAEQCSFTDSTNQVYRCALREGLTFSNGDRLDTRAVKYSIDRIKDINVNGGAQAGLLGSLERVQAPSEREVVFHLNKPDATFPFVLATPAMSIVDPDDYPADALREGNGVVGSGPYTLQSYEDGERAELVRNDRYEGFAERHNEAVTIRYFKDSAGMVKALRDGDIQVTYRGLAADDVIRLQGKEGKEENLQLVEGSGTEISYLVFNPEDPWAGRREVRQAVAQVIDRTVIAHKIYQDTVDPLYSMVPKGLTGHTTGFFDDYGDPSVPKAREILEDAGITEPVPLTLWYTTDRYGSERRWSSRSSSGSSTPPACSRSPSRAGPGRRTSPDTRRASTRPSAGAGPRTSRTRRTSSPPSSASRTRSARPTTRRRSPVSCCRARAGRATGPTWSESSRRSRSWWTTRGCCRCGRASSTWPSVPTSRARSRPWTRRRS
ncbi:hypothetical protein SVIOM342S_06164 [Streptomyces violaceorubidus]